MKKLLFLLLATTLTATAQEVPELTVENIYKYHAFTAQGLWGIKPLKEGNRFSKIEHDAQGNANIIAYSIETGEVTDTIFKGEWLVNDTGTIVPFQDYAIVEDQKLILLSTDIEPIYRHSTREFYYVWNAKMKNLTPLSLGGKQMYAAVSPDGNKVGFVRDNNIFYKNLETGEEVQVTFDGEENKIINGAPDWVYEEEFGINRAFFWSPDSKKIAYYKFDESDVKQFTMPIYSGQYPELYTFKYPKAGEENSIVDIWSYNLDNKKNKAIYSPRSRDTSVVIDPITLEERWEVTVNISSNPPYIPRIKWTEDPDVLSIQMMNRHQNELDLILANATTGEIKIILTEKSDTYIDIDDDLTFLKDNAGFIWTSDRDGYKHIYHYSMDGELLGQLTEGNWEVTNFYGVDEEEETTTIYFESTEVSPLERHIYRLTQHQKEKLSEKSGSHSASFTPSFDYFIHTHSEANTPPTVSVRKATGELVRVVEDNEQLAKTVNKLNLPKKEFFSFKTEEGVELNGWMIKPNDFDPKKKYPVFMVVYGGPGSQTVTNSWGHSSQVWYAYLAQQGYIVASVDNRGTGGRGRDFQKQTYLKLGELETVDQIAAAKYLGSLNYINKERIGIFGWSYGGYMSTLSLLHGSEAFKMAIAVAPVTHWKFYDTIYTERYMRTPKENEDGYEGGAPVNFAVKLNDENDKYLIMHGTADDNVHFQNTAAMVEALVEADKQFDTFFYPDKNHSLRGGNARYHIYKKMTDYILKNL